MIALQFAICVGSVFALGAAAILIIDVVSGPAPRILEPPLPPVLIKPPEGRGASA